MQKVKNPEEPKDVVKNWFWNRNTIEFLGLWERINNPNFKGGRIRPPLNSKTFNSLAKNKMISVKSYDVVLYQNKDEDFISLTDFAKYKDNKRTDYIIQN